MKKSKKDSGFIFILLVIAVLIAVPLIVLLQPDEEVYADLVLKNGVVQTMVNEETVYQAVAIADNRIIYVGDDEGVESFVNDDTNVIDLNGKMVTPGFMDSHIHELGAKLTELYKINLYGLTTVDEYINAARDFVNAHPEMPIVEGGTFDVNLFKDADGKTVISKTLLDEVTTTQAIILTDVSYHSNWLNSKALEIADVNRDTVAPSGCYIDKDASGEPTGYLVDCADLITELTITYTDEQLKTAQEAFAQEAVSLGVTGIKGMIHDFAGIESNKLLVELDNAGKLNFRNRTAYKVFPEYTTTQALSELKQDGRYTSNLVTGGSVKITYDGVTEGGTALMIEPYLEAAGMGTEWTGGEGYWGPEKLKTMVAFLDKEGYQLEIHAIGDRAVKESLDAFEYAVSQNGKRDSRHVLIHVCAITDEDIARAAELGVIFSQQFLWMYADPLYELEVAFVGQERADAFYPIKRQIEAGVLIAGGSDTPVTGYNPLEEIEVGVTRNSPYPGEEDTDMYRWEEQALTAYQMLEIYTKNVAYQNFWDEDLGTIEEGKIADLVVLDQNILTINPKQISDTKVIYTIVDGNIVYTAE